MDFWPTYGIAVAISTVLLHLMWWTSMGHRRWVATGQNDWLGGLFGAAFSSCLLMLPVAGLISWIW